MISADALTAVLLPLGAVFSLLGALGMVRFPDILTRLHSATKSQTTGLLLVLIGAAAQMNSVANLTPLLLVAIFQLMTSPVVAQTVGSIAYRTGAVHPAFLVVDETDERG